MTSYINDTLAAPTPLIPALPPIGALSGFPVVALGAADGGPAALVELFSAMPVDTGMAFILVALLDPSQAGLLPELLQKSTAMPVSQVSERTRVEPDNIYLISANLELKIREGVLEFQERSLPESSGLPIDTFFRSLAEQCGERAISIVLSGTGSDGALGIEAIKKARGLVLVQDETAEHCEMPHSAIATKLADHVLPAAGMPAALLSRAFSENGTPAVDSRDPADLEMIYRLLLRETGHDFASYKTSTIFRRVERRMSVNHI
ncbi:MAG: two-component system CheB/CheR fusion protein, partial [Polyangiales bacterium]